MARIFLVIALTTADLLLHCSGLYWMKDVRYALTRIREMDRRPAASGNMSCIIIYGSL